MAHDIRCKFICTKEDKSLSSDEDESSVGRIWMPRLDRGGTWTVENIRRHAYSWGDFNARDVGKPYKGSRPRFTLK